MGAEFGNFPGVMRGTVTRPGPVAGSVRVKVPRVHGPTAELGPFESVAGIDTSLLVAGARVLLAPVEGRADDLVVIALLR